MALAVLLKIVASSANVLTVAFSVHSTAPLSAVVISEDCVHVCVADYLLRSSSSSSSSSR